VSPLIPARSWPEFPALHEAKAGVLYLLIKEHINFLLILFSLILHVPSHIISDWGSFAGLISKLTKVELHGFDVAIACPYFTAVLY
jgi:hypothetical protein